MIRNNLRASLWKHPHAQTVSHLTPPSFRSVGAATSYGTRTNLTMAAPAGIVDNDILIAQIFTGSGTTAPTPTTLAGWTIFGINTNVTDTGGFNGKMWLYWKRASSESGNYTWTIANCNNTGYIECYSNCLATGTPLGATSNNSGTGQTNTGTGITTTAANSFLLWFSHDWGDTANNLTPPTGMTERVDITILYAADQLIASAGPTGDRTMGNNSNSTNPQATRMVELLGATS